MLKLRRVKTKKQSRKTQQNRTKYPIDSMNFGSRHVSIDINLASELINFLGGLSEISAAISNWRSFKVEKSKKRNDLINIFSGLGASLVDFFVSPIVDDTYDAITYLKEHNLQNEIPDFAWNNTNIAYLHQERILYSIFIKLNSKINQILLHIPTEAEAVHGAKRSTILCTYQI